MMVIRESRYGGSAVILLITHYLITNYISITDHGGYQRSAGCMKDLDLVLVLVVHQHNEMSVTSKSE